MPTTRIIASMARHAATGQAAEDALAPEVLIDVDGHTGSP
jgi:hypothetical protein